MRPWVPVFISFKAVAIVLAIEHHLAAALFVFFAPDPWVALQFVLPYQQAFGPAVTSFRTSRREVWLTIDDGPDPASTPAILELLREHGAHATFFVIGSQVEKHPDLARRIASEGHTLGNHTHTHPAGTFWCAPPGRIAREIDQCVGALLLSGASFERYFRPPVGVRNYFLNSELAARGMDLVLWNARGFDGAGCDPAVALKRITPQIRPGGILLSHEAGPRAAARIAFVEMLLSHLSEQGYSCVIPVRGALVSGG